MLGFEARGMEKLRVEKGTEVFFGGAGIIVTKYVFKEKKIWKDIDKTFAYLYLPVFLH